MNNCEQCKSFYLELERLRRLVPNGTYTLNVAHEEEIQRLTKQRDEARANYAFMVERAADEKLDGYRELGAIAYAAERERDEARERCAVAEQRALDAECERVPDEQRPIVPEWRKCVGGEPVVDRARMAAQLLVAEIGAKGPMDVVDAAEAAVTEIRRQSARATRSMSKLAAVAKLLVANGCDCDCDCEHHYEDHDDDCERCFACKVSAAIGELA